MPLVSTYTYILTWQTWPSQSSTSLGALNKHSGLTQGHLKHKPNFLQGQSVGVLIKIRGVEEEVR